MTALPETVPTGSLPGARPAPLPDVEPEQSTVFERFLIGLFVVVPLLAVAAAAWMAWGWGLGWRDALIAAIFYVVSGMGISMGFHRYFTHSSFKATRPLRVALAIAGSMAIEGPLLTWVADHRRHHKYSDREGDPHSPWRFGNDSKAVIKGLLYAHVGWLFDPNRTSQQKFCPDLLADPTIRRVSRAFPLWAAVSLLGPALIGGLWTMSWWGAVTAFFWATLVRVCLLHHVTWSINSVCHTFGKDEPSGQGPNLFGIFGRPLASEPSFKYSAGMKAAAPGKVWDDKLLDAWLTDTQTVAPGNAMTYFEGDEARRQKIIAYLRTLH